jgi:hypothetical protein
LIYFKTKNTTKQIMQSLPEFIETETETFNRAKQGQVSLICGAHGSNLTHTPFNFPLPSRNMQKNIALLLSIFLDDETKTMKMKLERCMELLRDYVAIDVTGNSDVLVICTPKIIDGHPTYELVRYSGASNIKHALNTMYVYEIPVAHKDVLTKMDVQSIERMFPSIHNEINIVKTAFDEEIKEKKKKIAKKKPSALNKAKLSSVEAHPLSNKSMKMTIYLLRLYYGSAYKRVITQHIFRPYNLFSFYEKHKGDEVSMMTELPLPHQLNVFPGFRYSHIPVDNLEKIYEKNKKKVGEVLKFMKQTLCQDRDDRFTYLMLFIMSMFRNPAEKPCHCPLFYGPQGSGKSWFFEHFIGPILGKRLVTTGCNMEHFFGNFNSLSEDKLLLVMEENTFNSEYQSRLKHFITGKTVVVRKMRTDASEVETYARMVFCSQEVKVKDISVDVRERRIVYMRTEKDTTPNATATFKKLLDKTKGYCMDEDILKGIYFLLTYEDHFYNTLLKVGDWSIGNAPAWAYDDLSIEEIGGGTVTYFLKQLLSGGVTMNKCLITGSAYTLEDATVEALEYYEPEVDNAKALIDNIMSWPKLVAMDDLYKLYCQFSTSKFPSSKPRGALNFWSEITRLFEGTRTDVNFGDVVHQETDLWGKPQIDVRTGEANIHRQTTLALAELPKYTSCCKSYLTTLRQETSPKNIADNFLKPRFNFNDLITRWNVDFLPSRENINRPSNPLTVPINAQTNNVNIPTPVSATSTFFTFNNNNNKY